MGTWADLVDESLSQIAVRTRGDSEDETIVEESFERLKKVIRVWGVDGLKVPGLSTFTHDVTAGQLDYTLGEGEVDIETPPLSEIRSLDYQRAGRTTFNQLNSLSYGSYVDRVRPDSIGPNAYFFERLDPISKLRFTAQTQPGDSFRLVGYGYLAPENIGLHDETALPGEYELALTYELAVQLGPSFGVFGNELADTRAEARRLRRIIERANRGESTLRLDQSWGRINTGVYHGSGRFGRVNRHGI